jgi:putative DNA primase/helicase
MAANYQDVLDQLHAAGLIVTSLEIGGMKRCRVEGDREKRGWYSLHELQLPSGDVLIVGSYGIWRGNDHQATKIELRKVELSVDQRAALKRSLAEDRKRAEEVRATAHRRAAARASAAWTKLLPEGESDYLARKSVGAYGLKFTKNGSAVLPMLDTAGRIHGLQFLRTPAAAEKARRPAKEFWPAGLAKKGHFHLIGPTPTWLILVAEGYATAASLHMATGYPVAVAFDAGNLMAVSEALRWRYKHARILICADDDTLGKCHHREQGGDPCRARISLSLHPKDCPTCGHPHRYENAGVAGASAAALAVNGAWVVPLFADPAARSQAWIDGKGKATDFNDLHLGEGLHVVRVQVEARLTALAWNPRVSSAPTSPPSGAGDGRLSPFQTVEQLIARFPLVYAHSSAVFDREEHVLMSVSDMRDACVNKYIHRAWQESPARQIMRIREVGFDPTGRDGEITCNLYGGWPTEPKAGCCDRLLELLRIMCSLDRNPEALYRWVLNWIAYPIQHPGAKMKSTLVVHGPQGTGKNLLFETVMAIYGQYGDVLDQSAVEDKFNDWASRKLFMIADEVVARSDVYHIKNKLKSLITGDRIRINPKNLPAHWERNHVNLVFLSNEAMPVVLEEDDRRHCVIWTPEKKSAEFYHAVLEEIRAGGAAALHDYLLHLDLGDFGPGTLPPITDAKSLLIALGLDSPIRFHDDLVTGDIPGLEATPGLSSDWYRAYVIWCGRHGYRPAPQSKFVVALTRQRDVAQARKRYQPGSKVLGPHSFLLLGQQAPPEGKSELFWLGGCHADFREMLEAFKEDK